MSIASSVPEGGESTKRKNEERSLVALIMAENKAPKESKELAAVALEIQNHRKEEASLQIGYVTRCSLKVIGSGIGRG